jgi:nucleotide-binding universal stress UspA family protein
MLKHILIPLDGSLLAERAIEAAKTILRPQGKITLVTAIHDGQAPTPETSASGENPVEQLQSYLERIATNLKLNGYEAAVEIREGEPPSVITELATILGVDVIAMCTHGRSGLSRLFAGSVTSEVLNLTPCPVLVIPNRERERVKEEAMEGSVSPSLAD